jgi:hypothetical protein
MCSGVHVFMFITCCCVDVNVINLRISFTSTFGVRCSLFNIRILWKTVSSLDLNAF